MPKNGLFLFLTITALLICSCASAPVTQNPTPTTPPPTPTSTALPVVIEKDLQYLKAIDPKMEDQQVDVYHPAGGGPWPVVVYAHGSTGSKNEELSQRLGMTLAGRGAVVYVIDWEPVLYEIALMDNGRGFRAYAETASCAVRFARGRAADYRGDGERVTWLGFSAGGVLGGAAALHVSDQEAIWGTFAGQGGPGPQAECVEMDASDRVDNLVVASGYFSLPESLKKDNPVLAEQLEKIYHLDANPELKVHIVYGTADNIVLPADIEDFSRVLKEAGLQVEETVLPGGHGLYQDQSIEAVLQLVESP